MIRKYVFQYTRWAVPVVLAAAFSGAVWAADTDAPVEPPAATKKKKTGKPKSAKVKFMPGSEETRAERRARLKIECRGAANAGMCTGYTR